MMDITISKIEKMIYVVRGQRVMLDSDLALLYQVETRIINRNASRNMNRFPSDFMFQLTKDEYSILISQIGISKTGSGGRRKLPYVFTENGVAMLSSILHSDRAILVNIAIMRIFTKLRSFLMMEEGLGNRMDKLEEGTNKMFKVVFERLDQIDDVLDPRLPENRRKIGIKKT